MEKRHEELKVLINDIYDIQAYQRLEEILISNIENVIFEENNFIPLILMAIFEALKTAPEKLNSLNAMVIDFLGKN